MFQQPIELQKPASPKFGLALGALLNADNKLDKDLYWSTDIFPYLSNFLSYRVQNIVTSIFGKHSKHYDQTELDLRCTPRTLQ